MLDIKGIRARPDLLDEGLQRRGKAPLSSEILKLDSEVRFWQTEMQKVQEQKNEHARQIGQKKAAGEALSAEEIAQKGQEFREQSKRLEENLALVQKKLEGLLQALPNIPADDCVVGTDEKDNQCLREVGVRPHFSFTPKEHHVLGEELGLLDIPRATKLSGSRFALLKGGLARLERSLAQFMLDVHTTEHGYTEMFVPALVNRNIVCGVGQLPKFAEDLFQTTEGQWLISTAEVPLTNIFRDEILAEKDLPIRLTAWTQCFRSEAGSAGKDIKGFFRQRQFEKIELVSLTTPEQEQAEHERMTSSAENILKKLKLPYRVMELCTGDMGFASRKTYDIEVWLPGQKRFREISSCSKCGDFQARRMDLRYRPQAEKGTAFVCTLNGSGLAVGRTLIALMENYQQEDGSLRIPDVLVPYMGGLEFLRKA
ncbi:serine--tRNA ligase [Alphaproteobacteria bacterium]|nr:serine--tRNA ligase [Alphaproteobacteria bacterium]GHS99060.1 serine--tRNA ligase [Alphaproteobacteria bacterium]